MRLQRGALFSLLAISAIFIQGSNAAPTESPFNTTSLPDFPATNYNMTMATLLLSTSPKLSELPRTVMTSYGHSFTAVELVVDGWLTDPEAKFLDTLVDAVGNPRYNSVIVVSAQLGYERRDGSWYSALTGEHWATLNRYLKR